MKMHKAFVATALASVCLSASGAWSAAAQQLPVTAATRAVEMQHFRPLSPRARVSNLATNTTALAHALSELDGVSAMPAVRRTASGHAVDAGYKTIEIDDARSTVAVFDRRAYDAASHVARDEALLVARVKQVVVHMGVDVNELELEVRGLGALDNAPGQGETGEGQRIATKVVGRRVVGGLPVLGDFCVVTFANDGSLRKVLCRWRRFETLTVNPAPAPESMRERAVMRVADAERSGVRLAAEGALRMFTFLRPNGADPSILELASAVRFPIQGPGGQVRHSELTVEPQ